MKIYRYLNESTIETYTDTDLGIPIFVDDTYEVVLTKIALGVATKLGDPDLGQYLPYAWCRQRALRFINFPAPANPWKYVAGTGSPNYNNSGLIGDLTYINIVFWKDLNNAVYFPDVPSFKIKTTFAVLQREAQLLQKLFNTNNKIPDITITRATFSGITSTSVQNAFTAITASQFVPFTQLVADTYNIQYKLFQKHVIPDVLLSQWTSYERVPKIAALIAMVHVPSSVYPLYARVVIDTKNTITVRYNADAREQLDWMSVKGHSKKITEHFQNVIRGGRINLQETSVSGRIDVRNISLSISDVAKVMSKLKSLYHVIKVVDDTVYAVVKRSANYKSKMDMADFIASRVALGVPLDEVVEDLVDLGLSKADIELWIEQYQNAEESDINEKRPKKVIGNSGAIVKVSKSPYGFKVSIENVATLSELHNVVRWMLGTLSVSLRAPAAPPPNPKKMPKAKTKPTTPSPVHSANEEDLLLAEELNFDGGAAGKQNQRYFLSQLQQADPTLFLDVKNYPRKCAANSFRQPVVVTPAEKEKYDPKTYDNAVLHGSDAEHQNYYMCPRVWCPVSRVPLTPAQAEKEGCPGGEQPIETYNDTYWGNDPNKPHYIGFLKEKTKTNLRIPCCGIRPPKDEDIEETVEDDKTVSHMQEKETNKEETYIINAAAPIEENRYGNLPKDIHDLLLPDTSYQLCSKTLSTQPCFVRRGIQHRTDSLMNAIATLLGFKSKGLLVKSIRDNLDPITFLSCGLVATFLKPTAVSVTPKLRAEWKTWLTKFPNYAKLLNVGGDISRELGVYTAWKRYIDYLEGPDTKDPHTIYNVVSELFNVTLLIWIKKDNQSASYKCMGNRDKHIIMMIEENGYFEPIELKARSKQGLPIVSVKDYPLVAAILKECPSHTSFSAEIIRGLFTWVDTVLVQPAPFRAASVVLRQDLYIQSIITQGNILVHITPLPIQALKSVLEATGAKRVIHHEDIAGKVLEVKDIYTQDYNLFVGKLQRIGFGVHVGAVSKMAYYFSSILPVPEINNTISPVILSSTNAQRFAALEANNRKWYQTQIAIGKYIESNSKNGVVLRKEAILDGVAKILPHTPQYMLQTIIQEIPLHAVHTWIQNIRAEARARILTLSIPVLEKNQWVFSQSAVEAGLPNVVVYPAKRIKPNTEYESPSVIERSKRTKQSKSPKLDITSSGESKKLPSKFIQGKNSAWVNYSVLHRTYTEANFVELLMYLSNRLGNQVLYDEVKLARSRIISELLRSQEASAVVLDDPSMINVWSTHFKKKFPKGHTELWSKALGKMSYLERRGVWQELSLNKTQLKPMEIDFYVMSRLLDINILIIHRSKYGDAKAKVTKRGYTDDMLLSASFFKASRLTRPIIMLFKEHGASQNNFYAILDDNRTFIHESAMDLPEEIQQFLQSLASRSTPYAV